MPYNSDYKKRTRQHILRSARRLFSEKGFEATSIDEIMLDCALTRGGFYAHFSSKGQLYQEAMRGIAPSAELQVAGLGSGIKGWIDDVLASCLPARASSHRAGSLWAFLAIDATSQQPEVRSAYSDTFNALSLRLQCEMSRNAGGERAALAMLAMIVGSLSVAMAVDDSELRIKLIEACRVHAKNLIEAEGKDEQPSYLWAVDTTHSLFSHRLASVQ